MVVRSLQELTSGKCQPCEGGVEPIERNGALEQLTALTGWELSDDGRMISRSWQLNNFRNAMVLLNAAAEIAEEDQHHPDLHLTGYRNLQINLTTHAISGLSENDFIIAAKIEAAAKEV